MSLKKIIRLFYYMFTIYVVLLIGSSTLGVGDTLPALIILWLNYFFFSFGYSTFSKRKHGAEKKEIIGWLFKISGKQLLGIALLSIAFSILAVQYYAGQTPLTVIYNLSNNISVYYEYQSYFREQQRNVFSIGKIPFILMLFYIKAVLFYSYITFFTSEKKLKFIQKLYLLLVTIAYIYVGVSRGTSFEFFELVILTSFVVFSKRKFDRKRRLSMKPLVASIFMGILGLNIFFSGISSRGVQFNPNIVRQDVNFNFEGWLTDLSPSMAEIVFRLYGYFGFGFYYISTYFNNVWFSSGSSFFSGLIPLGYRVTSGYDITTVMNDLVHVGVKWHPDFIRLNNLVGYLGVVIICFMLGVLTKYFSVIDKNKPLVGLTNFLILLQMVSLPVGNFLFISSANQLIVALVIVYWVWRVFVNKKIVF